MRDELFIPGLAGNYDRWPYYQIILSIEDIVRNFGTNDNPDYRIKTTDEVEVIYSQSGVNNLLQRVLDSRRLEPIRKFINEQPDSYVNNLTIAIYGGDPQWLPIEIRKSSLDEKIDEDKFEELSSYYGLIKMTGDETLFVLDGQHRLKALRLAYAQDSNIGNRQIALTLIAHIDNVEGKKRTRRLFSIINRYAKPVSLGENILLDEDDLSAILVRITIDEYPLFIGKKLIALNKTANLVLPTDAAKFSSVIELWNINELLIDYREVYPTFSGPKSNLVRIRPNEDYIEKYKSIVFVFWNIFFSCFPNAKDFLENVNENVREHGGPLSLRPIGQQIFCEYFIKMKQLNRLHQMKQLIQLIPDNIADPFWHNILFNPISNTIIGSKAFARDYIYYHLNVPLTRSQLSALKMNYRKAMQDERVNLPTRLSL